MNAHARPNRREIAFFVLVLLLASGLRLGWPGLTEFKFAEARLVALVRQTLHGPAIPLIGVPASVGFDHAPISMYLYLPPFAISDNLIVATWYGGLMGVAGIALVWWLARRWYGPRTAAIAALLLAVSPWAVFFSRKIWQIVFVTPLVVGFVGLSAAALVEERRGALAAALVSYALVVQVHPSAVSLLPALLLWLAVAWRRVRWHEFLLGTLGGGLTALPFLVHQWQTGWPILAAARDLPRATWDATAFRLAWEVATGRSVLALAGPQHVSEVGLPLWLVRSFSVLGWMALISLGCLIWTSIRGWRSDDPWRRRRARMDAILCSWLVIPVVFNLRHSVDLYLHSWAIVSPAALMIVAWGADRALRRSPSRIWRGAGWAALASLALAQVLVIGWILGFVAEHATPGGFGAPLRRRLELAQWLEASLHRQSAGEVLVVGPGYSPETEAEPAVFDAILRDRVPFRLVDGRQTALFPSQAALALLAPDAGPMAVLYPEAATLEAVRETPEGIYELWALAGQAPTADLVPVSGLRLLSNGVEILGWSWHGLLVPGSAGEIWIGWRVAWTDGRESHLFAHLVSAAGDRWAGADIAGFPASARRQGDWIVNRLPVALPLDAPAGPLWLRVGMYTYPEVTPLPVLDEAAQPAADALVLGPLVVESQGD